ncbi:hypothetical protein [Psychrobacter sp. AOP7-A1-24]|uniref:hypothetical protein n=1 Tax=Psychrobacter sp. AOP7-A1-24 TaxID=3457646 RepID=UPI00402B13EC
MTSYLLERKFVSSYPDAMPVLSSVSRSNIATYENTKLIDAFLAVLEDEKSRGAQ